MIDDTPTPPVGILGQQRAAARQQSGHRVAAFVEERQRPAAPVAAAPAVAPPITRAAVPTVGPAVPAPAAPAGPTATGPGAATSSSGLVLPVRQPYRVVIADDPAAWSDGAEHSGLLDLPPSAKVTAFERLTDGDVRLVILCGHRQAGRVHREAAVARGILEARVAVVPLPNGPFGQYAMARIAERALAVADRLSTLIVSLLPDLASRLVDIGLVASVNALDIPGIKVRHHLVSYLPGSHLFAVQLTPTPYVAAAGGAQLRAAAAEAITGTNFGAAGTHVLITGPRPIPAALEERLGAPGSAIQVAPDLDLAGYWRDEEAGEVVMVPADPAAWVAQVVAVQSGRPCGWCGEVLAINAVSCVFCGHTPL